MSQPDDVQIEESPADAFVAELKRWRDVRGLSQSALARKVDYTPSYVSKVESGQQRPSDTFAESADRVLRTGGALVRSFAELDTHSRRSTAPANRKGADRSPGADSAPANLVVEHDEAELRYDGRAYRAHQRRQLYNASDAPITRYLIRISVDRHPGDPERSNLLYRENPLRWDELDLQALHEGKNPMTWSVRHDRDALKELWLRFENEHGRFPLYPGERAWIEYAYTVSDEKWGNWFQRAVRLPTKHLAVRLIFPSELEPMVWGMETTMTAEAFPLRTAIEHHQGDGNEVFCGPPMSRRCTPGTGSNRSSVGPPTSQAEPVSPSETMKALGIVQEGEPILRQVARPFDLPDEA